MVTRFDDDVIFGGDCAMAGTLTVPASAIADAEVKANAAIAVTKLRHYFVLSSNFAVQSNAAPASSYEEILMQASAAITIRNFRASLLDTGSSSDVKFDLFKDGSSILAATLDFTHGDSDGTIKTGSLSSATLAAGDYLIAKMIYASATGVKGPVAWVELDSPVAT